MITAERGYYGISRVDGLEIVSLIDNTADFLSTINRREVESFRQWTNKRYGEKWANAHLELPFAEHGFSMLIRILQSGKKVAILFDTGTSHSGIVENAKRMGIDLGEVEYIVLSHGHYDHFGGLMSALEAINKTEVPVIVHEDMFKQRGIMGSEGTIRVYPKFPTKEQLNSTRLIHTKEPRLFADTTFLVTGEIPRQTSFEKGFLRHRAFTKELWQPEPVIRDDRALVFNVKGKGLVILSGCAHAGIINTILYAQQVSGTQKVHAVIGGFHLAGKENEKRITQTVKDLARIGPELVVPCHCTGWRGILTIAKVLPEAFIWNSVGNLYEIQTKIAE
jgi:7,8-dihydropterin-6-yl-methyl-4-(beta-D-ribofuranosyl)aminobenzene 5'-phosphate synthase